MIFKLSSGGVKPLEGQELCIYAGAFYGYGYSDDPDRILVTRVEDQFIYYTRYPYHKEQREHIDHFRDIAWEGTRTELKKRIEPLASGKYGYVPEWAVTLRSHYIAVLNGQRGLEWSWEEEKMVGVEFSYDGPGDGWSEFEKYYPSSISGMDTSRNIYVSYDFNVREAAELCHKMEKGKLPGFSYKGSISYR